MPASHDSWPLTPGTPGGPALPDFAAPAAAVSDDDQYRPPDLRTLVESDGLTFRVVLSGRQHRDPASVDPAAEAVAEAFRAAFGKVWVALPFGARQRLLTLWQTSGWRSFWIKHLEKGYLVPMISVRGNTVWSESQVTWSHISGCKLDFPAELVVDRPERLEWEIACTLADVLRRANREDEGFSRVTEPYECWAEGDGVDATDDRRDEEWQKLYDPYARQRNQRIFEIVAAWGFSDPRSGQSVDTIVSALPGHAPDLVA